MTDEEKLENVKRLSEAVTNTFKAMFGESSLTTIFVRVPNTIGVDLLITEEAEIENCVAAMRIVDRDYGQESSNKTSAVSLEMRANSADKRRLN
jgi:hypothetical protein